MSNNSWTNNLIKKNYWQMFLSSFLAFMVSFATIALMFTSGYLITRAGQHPENILLIYVPIVLTRAFGIARPVFRYIQRLVSHNWVLKIVSKTRQKLFDVVAANTSVISKNSTTANSFSILNNDIEQLQNFYLRTLFPTIAAVIMYIFVVAFTGSFDLLTMIFWIVVIILIGMFLPVYVYSVLKPSVLKLKNQQKQYLNSTNNLIEGYFEWQTSGNAHKIIVENNQNYSQLKETDSKNRLFGWQRDFAINLVIGLATVVTIALISHNQNLDVNLIAAFGLAAMTLNDVFSAINAGISEAPYYEDSFSRLNNLNEKTDERVLSGTRNYEVEISDVSFQYGNSLPLFENVSFNIPEKQKIAIVGTSGSGKTTLVKMITGDLRPTRGLVTIGGELVTSVDEVSSNKIAVLDQKPYLFNMSIADNLKLVKPNLTDEEILKILKLAGLSKLIKELDKGIDTSVGELGSRFSGGEQQRIALARVLAKDSPIVILDEPTVGLDPVTESAVLKTIFKTLKKKTVIWITHHQIGLELTDKILTIKNNKVSLKNAKKIKKTK